jgi:hypothetical protein
MFFRIYSGLIIKLLIVYYTRSVLQTESLSPIVKFFLCIRKFSCVNTVPGTDKEFRGFIQSVNVSVRITPQLSPRKIRSTFCTA